MSKSLFQKNLKTSEKIFLLIQVASEINAYAPEPDIKTLTQLALRCIKFAQGSIAVMLNGNSRQEVAYFWLNRNLF